MQVSSLATEVFYEGEGFQPIVDFSKLIYSLELLLRLAWRVGKPGSTSCFVIAHATHCSYSHKVCQSIVAVLVPINSTTNLAADIHRLVLMLCTYNSLLFAGVCRRS